ncbi:BON domain-containing protein [Rhodoferax sp. GW822-FHT02A01]|uniref:BON domain-containing protein n=1 Tax=Rhodoferax sp. GW822-FHT02A01 TaxID=3141537 RepID=UPI00315CAA63
MKTLIQKSVLGLTLLAAVAGLSGCFPLLVGGAVTTVMVASDRRTPGTVVEDNGIQLKANNRIDDSLGDRGHIDVTAYNRQVLLTGEVPSEQDKQLVEKIVANVENVRSVLNELAVMGNSTLGQRSSDALVTSRVKANLVDAKDLYANAFKVTTERGTVYLMGRVTKREADRATEVVTATSGVQKLVRILEIISEDELVRMMQQPSDAKAQ